MVDSRRALHEQLIIVMDNTILDVAIPSLTAELGATNSRVQWIIDSYVLEVGINGMSMDDLAQRAGVSKTTTHRRWPSKQRLLFDALNHAMRPFDLIDTDSLRGDLDAYLGELARRRRRRRSADRRVDRPVLCRRLLSHDPLDGDFVERLLRTVLPTV